MTALLAGVYPIALVVGFMALPYGGPILRLSLMAASAPGLLRLRHAKATHRRWFTLLALYLAVTTAATFSAVDLSLAVSDLQRQIFIVVVTGSLSLALVDPRPRAAFVMGALVLGLAAGLLIMVLFGQFAGSPLLGPVQATFKAYAVDSFDVGLNSVSFLGVLALATGLAGLRPKLGSVTVIASAAVLIAIAVVASGSRTTLFSVLVAAPVAVVLGMMHAQRRVPAWVPYSCFTVAGAWAALTFRDGLGQLANSSTLNDLTTGRLVLWHAAWSKFADRPLFGWGGGSFTFDLGGYVPGIGIYGSTDVGGLETTGGAHNAYLTVLAERGILAGIVAVCISLFMLHLAVRLMGSAGRLTGLDRNLALLAPFIVLLIIVRSFGELPGWFGYADSLVDFLAFGVAALLVATASQLDENPEAGP